MDGHRPSSRVGDDHQTKGRHHQAAGRGIRQTEEDHDRHAGRFAVCAGLKQPIPRHHRANEPDADAPDADAKNARQRHGHAGDGAQTRGDALPDGAARGRDSEDQHRAAVEGRRSGCGSTAREALQGEAWSAARCHRGGSGQEDRYDTGRGQHAETGSGQNSARAEEGRRQPTSPSREADHVDAGEGQGRVPHATTGAHHEEDEEDASGQQCAAERRPATGRIRPQHAGDQAAHDTATAITAQFGHQ